MVKTRENRGEKPRLSNFRTTLPVVRNFRTTLPVVRNFRTTHPLCEFAFVPIFKKCMLSVPSQNLSANFTGIRTLCEPCANSFFVTKFQSHALYLGEPQECESRTSSLKAVFSSSNTKLLLHFSQYLSSDHPIPSLSPFSSSFPILNTTMAAHLHSSTP